MGAKMTGWKEVGEDLHHASEEIINAGEKIVGKGCLNIKRQAQQIIRANSPRGYLPHYPGSITYEVTAGNADISGVVGPDVARLQGGLGRIIEDGTVNNAPIPHLSPSLDAEVPRFEQAVADLAEELIAGGAGPDGPVVDGGD